MKKVLKEHIQTQNTIEREIIISKLPYKGEHIKESLTAVKIAQLTGYPTVKVSRHLQYLKKHNKVKQYRGKKWGRSEELFASF